MECGSRLGPYEIQDRLGAGGMGEVFLAQDTRLGRKVAVKVLPAQFAADPERLARFEQEARAAAALNHPHIAAVFDVGVEAGGQGATIHYMVQEYLQGEPLRALLERGPLPLPRALEIATEVTEALGAAHRAGIVHRDLKPDNVFVTPDGHAKVLDFGLAKLTEVAAGTAGEQSMSPTILGTQTGAIMGTAGYMAPEQVNGQEVDARADLFAFGCLLYEMASGKRAFAGQSLIQTLNRIAHEEPAPLTNVAAGLPIELWRIVRKCLAKSPARRYQTAADLTVDLLALGADVETGRARVATAATADHATAKPTRAIAAAGLVGLLLGVSAMAIFAWLSTADEPAQLSRVGLTLERPSYGVSGPPLLSISPDGRRVAYTTIDGLFVRDLDRFDVRAIPDSEEFNTPVLSPDGEWIAFQAQSGLSKVALAGGPRMSLCPGAVRGADWGGDDVLVFGTLGGGLMRVSAVGGDCTEITTLGDDEFGHYRPEILPDGRNVLFTVWTGSLDTSQIAVVPIGGGEHRTLKITGSFPRYVETGHLVFARDGSLWGVSFDLESLQPRGNPVPLLEGLQVESSSGAAQFDVARNGSLVYAPGGGTTGMQELFWVDRAGNATAVGAPPGPYYDPAVSPDGRRIAVTRYGDASVDVHIWDTGRDRLTRATFDDGEETNPLWSADGTELVYVSSAEGGGIYRRRTDGTGDARRMTGRGMPWSWTHEDGLLFGRESQQYVLSGEGEDGEPLPGLPDGVTRLTLSPDGRWLAYQQTIAGREQVLVRPFPDLEGGLWQVSTSRGYEPRWSADGGELYFRGENFTLWAAAIETEPTFSASTPELLFSAAGYAWLGRPRTYDVAPDGRFLLLESVAVTSQPGAESLPGIVLVQRWDRELSRLVPTDR